MLLPPFEMAVLDGGVRSVMNSYAEIDGAPVGATPEYLTDVLRGRWGFDGVVVSDYFSVAFLQVMHAVAGDRGEAAELALAAGIDVELPTGDAYLAPLAERIRAGLADESLVDRAVLRVLAEKEELGLLDATFEAPPTSIDLDTPAHRDVARRLAEESVVLLANDGTLPLASADRPAPRRIALIGPNADSAEALMGCYSFANHVLAHHPGTPLGFAIPTVAEALRVELPDSELVLVAGAEVEGDDRSGFDAAVDEACRADLAVVVVGDRAGLFGRGTVGEGNDVESLDLPGVQRELVEAIQATGTPVVMVLLTGRPYAVAWAIEGESAPAAVQQAFFPGEEGGSAIAGVLSGRVSPSGRLPVSLPRSAGAQPFSYLHPILGGPSEVTSADPTPVLPYGHGLSYTSFARTGLAVAASEVRAGESFTASVEVRNTGDRDGTDVVQLYARDVQGSVTRPVALLGYLRLDLTAGESARVRFEVPTTRLAFTDPRYLRSVEPGAVELWVGPSSAVRETEAAIEIAGPVHHVTIADERYVRTSVGPVGASAGAPAVPARVLEPSGSGRLRPAARSPGATSSRRGDRGSVVRPARRPDVDRPVAGRPVAGRPVAGRPVSRARGGRARPRARGRGARPGAGPCPRGSRRQPRAGAPGGSARRGRACRRRPARRSSPRHPRPRGAPGGPRRRTPAPPPRPWSAPRSR